MQRRYSRIIACQSGPSFRHCAAVPILFDFRHRCCSKWHGMFNDQRRAKGLKDCSNFGLLPHRWDETKGSILPPGGLETEKSPDERPGRVLPECAEREAPTPQRRER